MPNRGRSCGPWEVKPPAGNRTVRDILRRDPTVARNIFVGNHAWEAGGGIRFCFFGGALPEPTVADNLIIGNRASERGGGLVILDAAITCTNTTIVGNECSDGPGGGIIVAEDGVLTLRNSIVAGNTGSGICLLQWGNLVTDHCNVFGNSSDDYEDCAPSATDISCEPEFCAPESGDYQLFETSCCQGAGAGGFDIGARGVGCFTVPDVLFYDNFSDQDDADWVRTSEGGAALEVDEGTYRGTLVTGAATSVVAAGFVTGNLSCQLLIQPETELPAGSVGLDVYLRRATPERYYRVNLSDTQGMLWKRIGAQEQLLLTFDCQLVTGGWQSLSFDLIDSQLSGYLENDDGPQEMFVYADDTMPILVGTLGVGLSGGGLSERIVRFDDVLVIARDSTQTAVPENEEAEHQSRPSDLASHIFPNPLNSATTIRFDLPVAQQTKLTIYSVDGRQIVTLVNEALSAGRHEAIWRGQDATGRIVAAGTYLYRLQAGALSETRKLLLLK